MQPGSSRFICFHIRRQDSLLLNNIIKRNNSVKALNKILIETQEHRNSSAFYQLKCNTRIW